MKTILFIVTAFAALLVSCKDDDHGNPREIKTESIMATSDTMWHYYCAEAQKVVGTGVEADNEIWAGKTNWDIAFKKYDIKINGGTSGAQNKGGLAIYNGNMSFEDILDLPSNPDFKVDHNMTETINGVETTVSKSEYKVVNLTDGEYTEAPIYILRGDTGEKYYKIDIVAHMLDETPGYIKFKVAQIK